MMLGYIIYHTLCSWVYLMMSLLLAIYLGINCPLMFGRRLQMSPNTFLIAYSDGIALKFFWLVSHYRFQLVNQFQVNNVLLSSLSGTFSIQLMILELSYMCSFGQVFLPTKNVDVCGKFKISTVSADD